jgi:hypothetical protein
MSAKRGKNRVNKKRIMARMKKAIAAKKTIHISHKKMNGKTVLASKKSKPAARELSKTELVEKLSQEFSEIKALLVQKRKEGKDTLIEDLKLMFIPPKIQYLKAEFNEKVHSDAKAMLEEIRRSFQEQDEQFSAANPIQQNTDEEKKR